MFRSHTPKELRLLALAMGLKLGFYLHPVIGLAGWGLWLYLLRSRPRPFLLSLVSGLLSSLALFLFVSTLSQGGLQLSQETAFPYLAAYLLGIGASAAYTLVLSPYLGRWAYLWLLAGLFPAISLPVNLALRGAFIYHALRAVGRDQGEGQDSPQPEGGELHGAPGDPQEEKAQP